MSENIPWVRWKGHYVVVEGKPRENTPGCLRGKFTRICELDDELTARQKGHYIKRILSVPRLESENSDLRALLAQAEKERDALRAAVELCLGSFTVAEQKEADGAVASAISHRHEGLGMLRAVYDGAVPTLEVGAYSDNAKALRMIGMKASLWMSKVLSTAEKDRDAAVKASQDAIADAVIDNVLLQERLDKAVKGLEFIDAVLERPVSAGNVVEAKAKAHAILSELEGVSGE